MLGNSDRIILGTEMGIRDRISDKHFLEKERRRPSLLDDGKRKLLERQGSSESFDSSWSSYLDDDDDAASFCPPERKRIRRSKKSVRFATDNNEMKYRHITKEDLENAWLKPQDWERSKAECKEAIACLIKCNGDLALMDLERHCLRGLEEYISTVLFRRGSRQKTIVRKVVYVQHIQRKSGVKDQVALKEAYLELSKKHRRRALKRAAVDAYHSGAVKCYVSPRYPED
jgi:hypothetical protein